MKHLRVCIFLVPLIASLISCSTEGKLRINANNVQLSDAKNVRTLVYPCSEFKRQIKTSEDVEVLADETEKIAKELEAKGDVVMERYFITLWRSKDFITAERVLVMYKCDPSEAERYIQSVPPTP